MTAPALPAKPPSRLLRRMPNPFPGCSSRSSATMATASSPAPLPSSASIRKVAKPLPPAATPTTSTRKSAFPIPPTIFSTAQNEFAHAFPVSAALNTTQKLHSERQSEEEPLFLGLVFSFFAEPPMVNSQTADHNHGR